METSKKLRIAVTVLMLAAALCVLVGKSVTYFSGFSLSTNYIGALFPTEDSSVRHNFTVYVWMVLTSGVAAAALVWIRKPWAALVTGLVCLSSPVYHVIRSMENEYGVFQFDGIWDFLMVTLPVASVILCLALFRSVRAES